MKNMLFIFRDGDEQVLGLMKLSILQDQRIRGRFQLGSEEKEFISPTRTNLFHRFWRWIRSHQRFASLQFYYCICTTQTHL